MPTQEGHFFTVTPDGSDDGLRLLKGDGAPKVIGGYGGWAVTSRPHRIGLTTFTGLDPIRMSIPAVFESWLEGTGQEVRIGKLSRMALPQGDGEPTVVKISGPGIPEPGPKRWVIESLDWGDNVIWDLDDGGSMVRMRQDCTINLLQYVDEDRVAFSKLAAAGVGGGSWPKHWTWHKGKDTLRKVAAHFYHDSKKWKKIADANGIRDPQNIKDKRVLRIPKP